MFVVPKIILDWFSEKQWKPFEFQLECWKAIAEGKSGLLNAPTGSGKTYSIWLGILAKYLAFSEKEKKQINKKNTGLKVLWITPLRALSKDIHRAMVEACKGLGFDWNVAFRTGDTSVSERQYQKKTPPDCLITTPESLHLLLAQKNYSDYFKNLSFVVIDEWHELIGTKRGVQIELALSRLKSIVFNLQIWGISATIGNLEKAANVLIRKKDSILITSKVQKKIEVETILPDEVHDFTWTGQLGLNLIHKIIPIVNNSKSTLLFINTRGQSEIWYQKLLEVCPEWAGAIAIHHGSLDAEIRNWVEESLHKGILKLVVCTSSLDLGVDFRPVETVVQVGSPKGVARFLQRAGRSGHQPNEVSKIYFLPVHSLELIESISLKEIIKLLSKNNSTNSSQHFIESKNPIEKCFDVLIQYLVTLAISDGFEEKIVYEEIKNTFCFQNISIKEWKWCLQFITKGGESLQAYNEFEKVVIENNIYKIKSAKIALRHRLSIGTIVSEPLIKIQLVNGGYVGTVEEYFISKLKKGDVFWFAGRMLEFDKLKETTAYVVLSKQKKGQIPHWQGGRLSLSAELAQMLRLKIEQHESKNTIEYQLLQPIFSLQNQWSVIPKKNEFLIEQVKTSEGYHTFFFPFEGRGVHELMASLFAYRLTQMQPSTFTIAMNDYGFELLSDQQISVEYAIDNDLFSLKHFENDLEKSINKTELSKRKFREIAVISGLIFQGYPHKQKKSRHLQASSQLLYDVFAEYEPNNLLIKQSFEEVMNIMEQKRLYEVLKKIQKQKIIIKNTPKPSPFAFPILIDRMREQISSENIEERIAKMLAFNKKDF
ncbi:MAG: ligase-associated DNA damage response DEXH box helicase [Flammeovirgaceae bacterium]